MKKQSDAVYEATHAVFQENGVAFEDKSRPVAEFITKEQRAQIVNMVTEGILSGDVTFSDSARAKHNTADKVRTYVSGMVNNWHRKDERFNGGIKYQPKNPGSRAGSSDPEIKNLKLLLKSGRLDDKQAAIAQARIDEKTAELRAEKAKVDVDFDAIPTDLLEQLGIDGE